jgi:hypothetical protein
MLDRRSFTFFGCAGGWPLCLSPLTLSVLYPHSRHLAAKVRVLVGFLVREFRGTPHWQRGW